MSLTDEPVAERLVVFDHAIVDQRELAGPVAVRVGIFVGWRAMRGPAGMADAGTAGSGLVAQQADQILNPAGPLPQMQLIAGQGRQSGAVIAAVLQTMQSLDQQRLRFA